MTTTVHCSKCGGIFSSTESYQNHLPCSGSVTRGGAGDVRSGSEEVVKDDTGER